MRADEESFEKQAGMEVGGRERLSVSRLLDCMISYLSMLITRNGNYILGIIKTILSDSISNLKLNAELTSH